MSGFSSSPWTSSRRSRCASTSKIPPQNAHALLHVLDSVEQGIEFEHWLLVRGIAGVLLACAHYGGGEMVLQTLSSMKPQSGAHRRQNLGIVAPNYKNVPVLIPLLTCTNSRWARLRPVVPGVALRPETRLVRCGTRMRSDTDQRDTIAAGMGDDMLCVLDSEQKCVSVNDAFLRAFNRQEQDLLGHSVSDDAGRESFGGLMEAPLESILAGESASTQRWRDFPQLGFRYVRITLDPVRDAEGAVLGACLRVRDLTDARLSQEALEKSEQRFEDFAGVVHDWLFELDENLRFVYLSARFETVMDMPREQALGRRRMELFPGEDQASAVTRSHHRDLSRHLAFDGYQFSCILDDGSKRCIRMSGKPVFDENGRFRGYRGVARDMTESSELEKRLAHLAGHDALTGLVNRREFLQRLQRIVDTAGEDDSEHGLCYVDVDRFRMINDRCGHSAGDELLMALADLLREHIRRRDTLARVGGNAFAVLMEHCSLARIESVAQAVHEAVGGACFEHHGESVPCSVSVSVVPIGATTRCVDDVLVAADRACYAAKSAGGDRVLVYGKPDRRAARERRGRRRKITDY